MVRDMRSARSDGRHAHGDVSGDAHRCTVFISHSSQDHWFAASLALQLESRHFRAWIDESHMHVGDGIRPVIADGIGQCDFLLVVLSKSSVSSEWVSLELNLARERETREGLPDLIVPVLLADCEMPAFLSGRRQADFRLAIDDPSSICGCQGFVEVLERLYCPAAGETRINHCVNTLARRLGDSDFSERREACRHLRRLGGPAIVALERCLQDDEDPLVRNFAAWALAAVAGGHDVRAFDVLRRMLAHETDPLVRRTISDALTNPRTRPGGSSESKPVDGSSTS